MVVCVQDTHHLLTDRDGYECFLLFFSSETSKLAGAKKKKV